MTSGQDLGNYGYSDSVFFLISLLSIEPDLANYVLSNDETLQYIVI